MKPYYESKRATLYHTDVMAGLPLPDESVHCVVTSPPYWNLRDYGVEGQLGLEKTPEEFVSNMVTVFREVKRVLRNDGTIFLNLGDSYSTVAHNGLKPKDLCMIPARVAIALQDDGWWLRSDIIWAKRNCLPESVTDRPSKSYEHVFLLTKQPRYFYDAEAIREPYSESYANDTRHETGSTDESAKNGYAEAGAQNPKHVHRLFDKPLGAGRNKRDVWFIATHAFPDAHFATYPPKLVEPCMLAGTSEKGCCPNCGAPWGRNIERTPNYSRREETHTPNHSSTKADSTGWRPPTITMNDWQPTCSCGIEDTVPCTVLDPFNGSGTSGLVALRFGRKYIGVDINTEYLDMASRRLDKAQEQGTLALEVA